MSLTATASPPADVGLSLSLRALQTRLVVSCGLTAKPAALSSLFPPKIVRQTQSAGSCVPSKAHRERRGAAQQLLAPVLRPKAASLAADRNSHCRKQLSGEPWLLTQVWEGEELAMPAFPLGARPLAPGGRRMWLVARTGDTIGKFRDRSSLEANAQFAGKSPRGRNDGQLFFWLQDIDGSGPKAFLRWKMTLFLRDPS
ncbi:hypothetical protein CISG_04158 [Coccidioides immitis RMSCC 3703]|uniref:Uncharacterized protein n=1 Tax=Coccidioides immitis RMSCC 3703 TaxID=454286 RepID=A0A0J8QT52_COCIT|nr:hypothetical protein CISG_04158 [Coccidioides immitis RMSCC 3703]